jgi:2-dehydro-3-deoxyphosphooctonate aldolase (KDO 8-P synthase)
MNFSLKNFSKNSPFYIMAGPCVIETEELCLKIADKLKAVSEKVGIPVIFKASFDKANRTSGKSFRGPGIEKGLKILNKVREKTGLNLITDIHLPEQAQPVAEVCDILQIPAFLCRQTDLLMAAVETKKVINIKKGQFMSPWATNHLVSKIKDVDPNIEVALTERGASFGYGNMVVDMRAFPVMSEWADSVIYDATHSLQLPSSGGAKTGGQREYVPTLAKAAMATGYVDGVFMEVHPEPAKSPSDADNILPLDEFESLLIQLKRIKEATM